MRLEQLGFTRVYDYVAGKEDWFSAMLPSEGNSELPLRAREAVTRDVLTCRPSDRIDAIRDGGRCVVTDEHGVVLGLLTSDALRAPGDGAAESRMRPGPTTIRPNEWLGELVERMRAAGVTRVIVTNPDGVLLGEVRRDRAEALLHEAHGQHDHAGRT